MKHFIFKIFFIFLLLPGKLDAVAQVPVADSLPATDLVISYDIKVETGQKKTSIGDVYDGGSKTIFISKKKARVRLVSLMRIESIYFLPVNDSIYNIYRVKESVKKPEKKVITADSWKALNSKYEQSICEFKSDSINILVYKCYKAVVTLADGRKMEVYYTKELHHINPLVEPAFTTVPGVVLQYSYAYKAGTITYTAVSVNKGDISPSVFTITSKPLDKISL